VEWRTGKVREHVLPPHQNPVRVEHEEGYRYGQRKDQGVEQDADRSYRVDCPAVEVDRICQRERDDRLGVRTSVQLESIEQVAADDERVIEISTRRG
jgi:hypothetical protein